MASINIDDLQCTGCGRCVSVCPAGCIELKDIAVLTRPEKCISCGRCIRSCPVNAITFLRKERVR